MTSFKLSAGTAFPVTKVPKLGGGTLSIGTPRAPFDWQLVLVYRGKHCPICTRYLGELNEVLPQLDDLGIDVLAVSADPEDKARTQTGEAQPSFDIGYDLSVEQMQSLGLYVSEPRSPQETDRPFAEPGLFVINEQGLLQVVDISNAPFVRPNLQSLAMGLGFIRNPANNYPIRGTAA